MHWITAGVLSLASYYQVTFNDDLWRRNQRNIFEKFFCKKLSFVLTTICSINSKAQHAVYNTIPAFNFWLLWLLPGITNFPYHSIIESPSDVQSLQNDVDYLSSWCQGALMSFNADKSVVLRLHPRQAMDNNVRYQLSGEHLRSVSHQHDLSVIVDESLRPHR